VDNPLAESPVAQPRCRPSPLSPAFGRRSSQRRITAEDIVVSSYCCQRSLGDLPLGCTRLTQTGTIFPRQQYFRLQLVDAAWHVPALSRAAFRLAQVLLSSMLEKGRTRLELGAWTWAFHSFQRFPRLQLPGFLHFLARICPLIIPYIYLTDLLFRRGCLATIQPSRGPSHRRRTGPPSPCRFTASKPPTRLVCPPRSRVTPPDNTMAPRPGW